LTRLKHLTFRYIINRIALIFDEAIHPSNPWLTKDSVKIIDKHLKGHHLGLEIGSGRSTKWISKRIKKLISIEGDAYWFERVSSDCEFLIEQGKLNYNYLETVDQYLSLLNSLDSNSLNFCLIDGEHRDICALKVIDKISIGGMLVIDNINWYLPTKKTFSPYSRSIDDGYLNENWESFASLVFNWRYIHTSNGITDTGIFIK